MMIKKINNLDCNWYMTDLCMFIYMTITLEVKNLIQP